MDNVYIGCKSFYIDSNGKKINTIQVWEARSGNPVGEFVQNSPKIPRGCHICYTESYFWNQMAIYAPEEAKKLCKKYAMMSITGLHI